MVGFTELQVALKRLEDAPGPQRALSAALRRIGEKIAVEAPGFVSHRTGRHGDPSQPRLEDSVRVSAMLTGASVYSSAIYGGVQNVGGWTGANRGPHVSRGEASHWMNRAVEANQAFVAEQINAALDELLGEFSV